MNGEEVKTFEGSNGGVDIRLLDRKTVVGLYSTLVAAGVKGVAETVMFQLLGILSKNP